MASIKTDELAVEALDVVKIVVEVGRDASLHARWILHAQSQTLEVPSSSRQVRSSFCPIVNETRVFSCSSGRSGYHRVEEEEEEFQ